VSRLHLVLSSDDPSSLPVLIQDRILLFGKAFLIHSDCSGSAIEPNSDSIIGLVG